MKWRSPTGPLVHEHRVIERLVAVMAEQLDEIRRRREVDGRFIDAATDFIRTYADKCHHGKEEHILFRKLAEKQMHPQIAEMMQDLIREHAYARELTSRLVESNRAYSAGDASALETIESAMQRLVDFYPKHIEKEDHHFFRECLQYLNPEEQTDMLAEYDDLDRDLIHEKYRSLVEDLESEYS